MTSKTLQFKEGLMKTNLKRFWWISALYGLILFFTIPFTYLIQAPGVEVKWKRDLIENSLNFFSGQNQFQILAISVIPVALAVLLYRYLMTGKATAMIHSLPYNRRTLYVNQIASGIVLLLSPIILIAIILVGIKLFTSLGAYYTMVNILQWMIMTGLMNILIFSTAVFVAMFTGNSVVHIVFTYISHILPLGLFVLIQANLISLVYGLSGHTNYESAFRLLPFLTLFDVHNKFFILPLGDLLVYLLATVLFFTVGYYLYKKRNLEAASDIISFHAFRPIFKYGITLCGMLLGGIYFRDILGSNSMLVFGYLFSSLLSYTIAEMILQKSFRIWNSYRGYLVYSVIVILIFTGIKFDVFGYVHRIPAHEDVEEVYFGYSHYAWTQRENLDGENNRHYYAGNNYFFRDPENINNVMTLHRALLDDKISLKGIHQNRFIVYRLKNGKFQVRQYPIMEKEYETYLVPILNSMEYREATFPVINQSSKDIKLIQITDSRSSKQSLILGNQGEIQEVMTLLKEEVLSLSHEKMLNNSNIEYKQIQLIDSNDNIYSYPLHEDYDTIIEWLKEKNYYDSFTLLPEEIEYVALRKGYGYMDKYNETLKSIEVKDPELIAELLTFKDYNNYWVDQREMIYVTFYTKNSIPKQSLHYYVNITIPPDTVISDELKAYIDKLK